MTEESSATTVLGNRFELSGYFGNAHVFVNSQVTLQGLPAPAAASGVVVRRVFISSTIDDLTEYRHAMRQAIQRVQGEALLFEEDEGMRAFAGDVGVWQASLQQAQGYMGLCGHWYGALVPQNELSLPHLALRWALSRWQGQPAPPISLYTPEPGSQADQALRQLAQPLLPTDPAALQQHTQRLQGFYSDALRFVSPCAFADQRQLHDQVLVTYAYWRGATPLAAARGRAMVVGQPGMAAGERERVLGCLGRGVQVALVDAVVSQADGRADVPAVALLVVGAKDAGQRAFVEALRQRPSMQRGRAPKVGRPSQDQYDLVALVQWVADAIGHADPQSVELPEQLAEWVAPQLRHQQLCFMLDQVHRLAGGVTAFFRGFWQPLYRRLSEVRGANPAAYRLVAVLVGYSEDVVAALQADGQPVAVSGADFEKVQVLPVLAPFTSADVIAWLRDVLRLPDTPAGRYDQIAERVLVDDAGDVDGTPLAVFARLKDEAIWSEGVDND